MAKSGTKNFSCIRFGDKKFYDSKEYYDEVKNFSGRIFFKFMGENRCHESRPSIDQTRTTKVFYIETSLPKFFKVEEIEYVSFEGKIYRRKPSIIGGIDVILCFSHGLILFVQVKKIRFMSINDHQEIDKNNLCDRIIKEGFFKN